MSKSWERAEQFLAGLEAEGLIPPTPAAQAETAPVLATGTVDFLDRIDDELAEAVSMRTSPASLAVRHEAIVD
jgi:hypothetical protein